MIRVALVQMRMVDDAVVNWRAATRQIEAAADQGANIVCLPELVRTRYFCQTEDATHFDFAESIPGPSTEELAKLAARRGIVIIAPLFERRAAGIYHNSAVVLDADGSLAGHYRKMHIPDDPLFFEKFYFTPGDLGFRAVRTRFGSIGVLICWDQWFPESARLATLAGADLLFFPTAIGWIASEKEAEGQRQKNAWETVQRGHAIANGVYLAAVNRVGIEGELEFWGGSFVADPMGEVIARASAAEQLLLADCDLGQVEATRRTWPFLRDRRIDAYGGLLERWGGP